MAGRIVLAATPIGNSGDASARLVDALQTATVVAAEDTRRLFDLARRLGLTVGGEVVSLNDHNEQDKAGGLVARAASGAVVLVVSDAGTPTVSDPGYRIVTMAAEAGVEVTALPGPSAVLMALAVSALATDRFCFEGFPPRRPSERATALDALAYESRTMVFFEAPHRVAETLDSMTEAFGSERPAAVCRELTKTHEEVRRGTLAELAAWARDGEPRGEIVLVVAGAPERAASLDALVREVLDRTSRGERLKDAAADVAAAVGTSTRELYAAAIDAKAAP